MSEHTPQQYKEMEVALEFYKMKCKLQEKGQRSLMKQVASLEKLLETQDEVMSALGEKVSALEDETARLRAMEGQMTHLMNCIDRLGETLEEMWRCRNQHSDSDSEDDGFVSCNESSENKF